MSASPPRLCALSAPTPVVPVSGEWQPHFEPVRRAFIDNFSDGHEIGACVCIVQRGAVVVDLWGGYRDAARRQPWQRDTLVNCASVTKSVAAICLLHLADAGALDLDQPIARFWPTFGAHGKESITPRMVLAQLAGLPYLDALPLGALWDPIAVASAIEDQSPEWPPGTTPCYHSFSAGLLYDQIMRRVDGRSIGRYLREMIADPMQIDFHIGLTEEQDARRAQFVANRAAPSWGAMRGGGDSPLGRAWQSLPHDEDKNSRAWRFEEFASAAGHACARGVARLYGALATAGGLNGHRLLSAQMIEQSVHEQWSAVERMTHRHMRFGTGLMLSCPPFTFGGKARNFGHPGAGGAVGFADPENAIGFCYLPNHMAPFADEGPYARRLIAALYESLS